MTRSSSTLRGDIGVFQYLALGFGTIIGSGWVILLGTWLTEAGPGGTILAFVCGGAVMMVIGACYAELATRMPEVGSEFIYAHRVYGRRLAFVVGWFLILYLISVAVFEGLALAWISESLLPTESATVLYSAFGADISFRSLCVSIVGALILLGLNFRGAKLAVVSHSILTYGFLAVVLAVLAFLVAHGRAENAQPWFGTLNGTPWWWGTGAIFAFCAYGLNGFQAIPQAIEERSNRVGLRSIAFSIVASIGAAAAFYALVVACSSIATPWRSIATTSFPTISAAAALHGYGSTLAKALLVATAASLFKAWNGVFMMAARLLVAMGRAGYIPASFAKIHSNYGSPGTALVFIAVCNIGGVFLGRGAVEPIADMCAMMLTMTYLLCCVTVLRLRRLEPSVHFSVPGGTAVVYAGAAGATIMAVTAFVSPFWRQPGTMPLEWRLLGLWSALGLVVWWCRIRRTATQ
jgi:amino acid transporter